MTLESLISALNLAVEPSLMTDSDLGRTCDTCTLDEIHAATDSWASS